MAHADYIRTLLEGGLPRPVAERIAALDDKANAALERGDYAEQRDLYNQIDRLKHAPWPYAATDGTPAPPLAINRAAAEAAREAGIDYIHSGYRREGDGSYTLHLRRDSDIGRSATEAAPRVLRLYDGILYERLRAVHAAVTAYGQSQAPSTRAALCRAQGAFQRLVQSPRAEQRAQDHEDAGALLPLGEHAADTYDALPEEPYHVTLRIRLTNILGVVPGPRIVAMERALGRPVWGTKQLSGSECGRVHAWLDAKYGPAAGRPHVADAA
ncbi:MAG: hypothetical protein AAGG50_03820 [Bacteroidota bacterium]